LAWKVEIKASAAKEIARFDKPVQRRIYDSLKQIESSNDPKKPAATLPWPTCRVLEETARGLSAGMRNPRHQGYGHGGQGRTQKPGLWLMPVMGDEILRSLFIASLAP
jgi:hypothetical protein